MSMRNGYISSDNGQGMGLPDRCGCGGGLELEKLGWTCVECRTGFGREYDDDALERHHQDRVSARNRNDDDDPPAKPVSVALTWSNASWKERIFLVLLYAFGWCIVFPAMLIATLLVLGAMIEGIAHDKQQHDSCLKHATNGYAIRECR
jgi:hypothetical protein